MLQRLRKPYGPNVQKRLSQAYRKHIGSFLLAQKYQCYLQLFSSVTVSNQDAKGLEKRKANAKDKFMISIYLSMMAITSCIMPIICLEYLLVNYGHERKFSRGFAYLGVRLKVCFGGFFFKLQIIQCFMINSLI